jgi:hypothetical protein
MVYFSSSLASIASVIPAMDQIVAPLKSQTKKIHPAIATALNLAWKKMDCYYSLTNASSVYWIIMGALPGDDTTQGLTCFQCSIQASN